MDHSGGWRYKEGGSAASKSDQGWLSTAEDKGVLLYLEGNIFNQKINFLVDSGASDNFLSEAVARQLALPVTEI